MSTTFADLGVPTELARSLENRGILAPFPIQAATIPDVLAGRDLSGRAPTGSGKTIAFGIPLVLRIQRSRPKHPKGLVLVPTRELATQVAEELVALTGGELRVHAIYGGVGFEGQNGAADEMKDPQKDVPTSILSSGALAAFCYLVPIFLVLLVLPIVLFQHFQARAQEAGR